MDSRVLSDEKINERMQQPFSPYLEVVGELEKILDNSVNFPVKCPDEVVARNAIMTRNLPWC